jgi:hypothetical protein
MATYDSPLVYEVQKGEKIAARRRFYVPVHTAESKVVTVSKNCAAFDTTAGSTMTQIEDVFYKLDLHVTDINTLGPCAFKLAGATHTDRVVVHVVAYDPFSEGAKSYQDQRMQAVQGVG